VVSKVVTLSTAGISPPPSSVASLIFLHEKKINTLEIITVKVSTRYLCFTKIVYSGLEIPSPRRRGKV
jgi:hypothetical protein